MNQKIAKFWWGQRADEHRIHWENYKTLTQPIDREGMDFEDLHAFNLALLAKQCWRLLKNQDALWERVLQGI